MPRIPQGRRQFVPRAGRVATRDPGAEVAAARSLRGVASAAQGAINTTAQLVAQQNQAQKNLKDKLAQENAFNSLQAIAIESDNFARRPDANPDGTEMLNDFDQDYAQKSKAFIDSLDSDSQGIAQLQADRVRNNMALKLSRDSRSRFLKFTEESVEDISNQIGVQTFQSPDQFTESAVRLNELIDETETNLGVDLSEIRKRKIDELVIDTVNGFIEKEDYVKASLASS